MNSLILEASLADVVARDAKALNLINFLTLNLPQVLAVRYDIKCDTHKLAKNKYEDYYKKFIDTCSVLHFSNFPSSIKPALKANQLEAEDIDVLNDYLKKNKEKIKELAKESVTEVNKIINFYKSKAITDAMLENMRLMSMYLPDIYIRRMLRTIAGLSREDTIATFVANKNDLNDLLQKHGLTLQTPKDSPKFLKLKENVAEYKAYTKLLSNDRKYAKWMLSHEFDDSNYELISNEQAAKILSKHGIPNPIPKGLVCKVGLNSNSTALFDYYTIYGKKLEAIPLEDIEMNPKYTINDDTCYCTGKSAANSKDNLYYCYTEDYRRRSHERKFSKILNLTDEELEKIRRQYTQDFMPLLNGQLTNRAISALVVAVLDNTAGRIGDDKASHEEGNYGIHSLISDQVKILPVNEVALNPDVDPSLDSFPDYDRPEYAAVFDYSGKKGVMQHHVILDPLIVRALRTLQLHKNPGDCLFSARAGKPIAASSINKYIKSIGFPDSAHAFRRLHANRIFLENTKNPGIGREEVLKTFDTAVRRVAAKLGHNPSVSVESYISTPLIKDYFTRTKCPPPSNIQNILAKMNLAASVGQRLV